MYVGHKNINLQNVPPMFCKFICPDIISLTYLFISPLNVPSLDGEKPHAAAARRRRTPPPHAAAARRRRCLCRTPPLPAAATSLATAARHCGMP